MNTDKEILDLIAVDQSFDRGFKLLVQTFQERLYWHIRRMVHYHEDADDILQNVFIKVFKNIKGFKQQSKLFTWLFRIASNETISFLKKNKKHQMESISEIKVFSENLKADQYFNADQAILSLKEAIQTLPAKQRLVFNMRYYDEMAYSDLSQVLETSVGSLKASFHHATKKIENYLKENLDYVQY